MGTLWQLGIFCVLLWSWESQCTVGQNSKNVRKLLFLQTCTLGQKSKIYLKMLVYSIFNNWKFLNIFCRFGPMCSVKFCRHVCGTLPDKKSINSTLAQVTKVEIFGRSGISTIVYLLWLTSVNLLNIFGGLLESNIFCS